MPTIADYVIIADDKYPVFNNLTDPDSLPVEASIFFKLDPGASLGSRSILAFVVYTEEGNNVKFEVVINGSSQLSYTFSHYQIATSLHEVISANLLKLSPDPSEKPNQIIFRIIGGKGKFQFSDVILHYQLTI